MEITERIVTKKIYNINGLSLEQLATLGAILAPVGGGPKSPRKNIDELYKKLCEVAEDENLTFAEADCFKSSKGTHQTPGLYFGDGDILDMVANCEEEDDYEDEEEEDEDDF